MYSICNQEYCISSESYIDAVVLQETLQKSKEMLSSHIIYVYFLCCHLLCQFLQLFEINPAKLLSSAVSGSCPFHFNCCHYYCTIAQNITKTKTGVGQQFIQSSVKNCATWEPFIISSCFIFSYGREYHTCSYSTYSQEKL